MESKQLTDYPLEEQAELKNIMAFMVSHNIINIKRWGGDMELSLHCRDGTYAVDMRAGESKIGGDARTPQH
jgi:hypothetical protein